MAILNPTTVEIKRSFNTTPEKIYQAIGAGILFRSCGGKPESLQVDFREGGHYAFTCGLDNTHTGKFLQLIPNKLISFSWFDGSHVTITMSAQGETTLMHLLHQDIATPSNTTDFDGGWRNGINDFSPHVGRTITIERAFQAPLASVYKIFSAKEFFAETSCDVSSGEYDFRIGGKYSFLNTHVKNGFLKGEFTDITPKRIAFTWSGLNPLGPTGETLVAIDFTEEAGSTIVKLTHSGFPSDEQAKIHNGGWSNILDFLSKKK